MSKAVEDAFRYSKLVLATTTYNADIFPPMREFFLSDLTERNFQNRTVALIENGSWAPMAAKIMRAKLEKSKKIEFAEPVVTVNSAMKDDAAAQLNKLAHELCRDYIARSSDTADKNDLTALFNIGYGLYVVTSNDGKGTTDL